MPTLCSSELHYTSFSCAPKVFPTILSTEEGNDIITLSWLNRKHLYSTINFLKTKQNEIHRSRKMGGKKS